MLLFIALVAFGFVMGVLVTGALACLVFGLLHDEAVKAVEGYGGMRLFTDVPMPEAPHFKASLS
ncbi:hypothetical protein SAMN06295912_1574 [Sphingomonas laterariae]|uniref:Uncharacterized protein n=1 Tax=Edaphosphingomonas laterariae TaxID=861865 RepID=A0A239KPK7_9SPHN|nr:hypothetical protein [Sphingomonas laterariae]SNT19960.1 hypothetical protein SAMN06295912_1574 [Sphingomonas laterariae]